MSLRSVPKIACVDIAVRCQCGIGHTTGHGFDCAIRALWLLLLMALAGPDREKPQSSARINAGTAEPVRVSPPEAVAYPLELRMCNAPGRCAGHNSLPHAIDGRRSMRHQQV
jgi:hypothetical protein